MDNIQIKLTKTDKEILASYQTLLEGLADYLGNSYEFVLHSLENLESSVIKIVNGFHTNRKEGAPITDLALEMLERIDTEGLPGYISYLSKNKFGEPLKATTIAIYGEKERIIGLLCINFYLNTPLLSIIASITDAGDTNMVTFRDEHFADNVEEIILKAVEKTKDEVESDNSIPASLKNKFIINMLSNQGIFKLKDAVSITARLLNISKNTVYLHLRNQK